MIYGQDVKDEAISLYNTGLLVTEVVMQLKGPVYSTVYLWLTKAGVLRGRPRKEQLSINTGFSFEELCPALYKWAHYFENRSDGKYEFWELINSVWLRGEIQHLQNIKYVSKKVYHNMVDYIRECESRRGYAKHIALGNMRSLEYPIKSSKSADEVFLRDVILDRENILNKICAKDVWNLVFNNGLLSERKKAILRLMFEEDLTMREVGEKLGISQSRVSQLMKDVMPKLRAALTRKKY